MFGLGVVEILILGGGLVLAAGIVYMFTRRRD
jgi:hypothetical protein